ncbi:MAG: DUF4173 domain-containing protein [Lachnospiraceae bacterium]|nr:DUF4173 domain-containing protein [Lachnospiraceae bacterium]
MEKKLYFKKLELSIIYAVVFTVCLYKAPHGITFPVFAVATAAAFFVVLRFLGETVKQSAYVIVAGITVLAIHVCTTGSLRLILVDKLLIFVLFFVLFLNSLYDDEKWDVTGYCSAILQFLFSSVSFVGNVISEAVAIRREKAEEAAAAEAAGEKPQKEGVVRYVILGLIISVPLLLIIVPLLASSDAVFANVVSDALKFEIDEDVVGFTALAVFMFFVAFALLTRCTQRMVSLSMPVVEGKKRNPVTAITAVTVILIVYAIYCGIQVYYLFLGAGKLPEGYTYASYVHEGFYELVFVCLINLVMVLFCQKHSKENVVLRVLLTIVCVCTYVMLGSSLYRMILYIEAYGFTYLRAFVLWALAVIALVMAAAVALVHKADFPFVKCALGALVLTWAVFAFSYPDRWIARYNIENGFDTEYTCTELSTDAVPVVVSHWNGIGGSKLSAISYWEQFEDAIADEKDFRNFNFSESRAREALRKLR